MSVEVNAAGEAINRLSAMAPVSGDYTACVWVRPTGGIGASYRTAFTLVNGVATYTDYTGIYTGSVAADWTLAVGEAGVETVTANLPMTLTTWLHLAYVRSGTNQFFFVNGQPFDSLAIDVSGVAYTELWLGSDSFGTATGMRFNYFREWTAALSSAQLIAEMQSTTAVLATNLFTDCPLESDLLDVSGNSHDFAAVGSIAFVADHTLPVATVGTGVYPAPTPTTTNRELFRTLDLPSITQFTIMGWFRPDDLTNNIAQFFTLEETTVGDFLIWVRSTFPAPRELRLEVTDGFVSEVVNGTTTLTDVAWIHVALVKDNLDYFVYLSTEDGSVDCSLECQIVGSAVPIGPIELMTAQVAAEEACQMVKVWEAALTVVEIQAERATPVAVRTANLYAETPVQGAIDLGDVSGQNHPWFPQGELNNAPPPDIAGGPAPPPTAPDNLFATYDSVLERITLHWDDNSTDETGFQLWRCVGSGCTDFVLYLTVSAGATSGDGGSVEPNTFYRYKVRAAGLGGESDFSNIAEILTDPIFSVRFPGTAGSYYHASPGLSHAWPGDPLGDGTVIAWIKPENTGMATIFTVIENHVQVFEGVGVDPVDPDRWDFDDPIQGWIWFGLRNGRLTAEVYDGRVGARGFLGGDITYGFGPSAIAARAADIAAYDSLNLTVPARYRAEAVPYETVIPGPETILYSCSYPGGIDASHDGPRFSPDDWSQFVTVTGPEIPNGVWSRVGFRWTTTLGPVVSTIEVFTDCAVAASGPWPNYGPSDVPFLDFYRNALGTRRVDFFVGGEPNATHADGLPQVAINIYDLKLWDTSILYGVIAEECDCAGIQPDLWWKLRTATDLEDYGNGLSSGGGDYDPLVVGSGIGNGSTIPINPCNGSGDTPPPGGGGGEPPGGGGGGGSGGGTGPQGNEGCPPEWATPPVDGDACAPSWPV